MLGKIIGAAVGGKLAKQTKGIGGTTGAMIGAAAPFVLSRLSIPAMIALGVGGYAAKKFFGKDSEEQPQPTNPETAPVASVPQPATA
ncbi:hypothetical protein [Erythrobacter rubeus]|uniref:Uncharacterized protein n=1 Tax=Erythrobacter rubeus TaxID=2760803 RepID=A0ABR8KU00_9SPHN|nr:hypothetical protein [Erythrobacter rubeus]MBD2843075.1 hypothetical protein [Erythrobacter rubeus]